MRLTYREKQIFFTQLAQLLRAGVALPVAAEKLERNSSSHVRATARRLRKLTAEGKSAPEAFEALNPPLGALERTSLAALARTGRLELGLTRLAEYFGVLARARAEMITQSIYPVVMLHLGVLLLNVNLLVGEGGLPAYARATGAVLGIFYGLVLIAAFVVPLLSRAGANDASLDAALRRLPMIGKARRALAVSRFCGTFDLQLDAGVNVIESLTMAARASRSGLLSKLAHKAVKRLREGQSLAEVMGSVRGALPGPVLDAIVIAEESGELHRVLPELRAEYEEEGLRRLRTAATWIPKILYLSVVIYLGYRIVSFYANYFKGLNAIMDGINN